jgi:Terminase small subunit
MPTLENPRYERFAQALFAGLAGETRVKRAQSTAYLTAYPNCSNGNSAEAAASRLLRRVKPIIERIQELQAQAAEQTKETAEKCVQELNELKRKAQQDKAYSAAVSAVMGKVKILNLTTEQPTQIDFKQAKSMTDIGRKLLQSVGFHEPDDASIKAAIEANDAFIDRLTAIRDAAPTLAVERDE